MMYQGMRLEDFLKYTGQTLEQMREMYREQAQERVHTRLALEALKKAEGIEATEADIDAELQKVADAQNKPLDEIKEKLAAGGDGFAGGGAHMDPGVQRLVGAVQHLRRGGGGGGGQGSAGHRLHRRLHDVERRLGHQQVPEHHRRAALTS